MVDYDSQPLQCDVTKYHKARSNKAKRAAMLKHDHIFTCTRYVLGIILAKEFLELNFADSRII